MTSFLWNWGPTISNSNGSNSLGDAAMISYVNSLILKILARVSNKYRYVILLYRSSVMQ